MDYRKILLYLLIIVAAIVYWQHRKSEVAAYQRTADVYVDVFSSLSVLAEIYRNEPERYNRARDSVFELYDFNGDSLTAFRERLEGDEDKWPDIWSNIRHRGDSLINYYKTHPVDHPIPDTADTL